MESDEYNKLFDRGLRIRNEGITLQDAGNALDSDRKFREAIEVFERLYSVDIQPDKFNKCLILGGMYKWVGDKERAYQLFQTAVGINPSSEIASLCLYLAFIDLGKSDRAIGEISRFLDIYPAMLYKDTLEELIGEINEGRLSLYKDKILSLAMKN